MHAPEIFWPRRLEYLALLSCLVLHISSGHGSKATFPLPSNLEFYTESSDHFFAYFYAIVPLADDQVLYGLLIGPTQQDRNSYHTLWIQQDNTAVRLQVNPADDNLTVGTSFASDGKSNIFVIYEGVTSQWYTHVYTATFNITSSRLHEQPTVWVNPPIPEPCYNLTGGLVGHFTPNSSVVADASVSYGSYTTLYSADGQYIYLLIRTDFFGSLKLLKYTAADFVLVWKQVIKPQVEGRSGIIPFGVGLLSIDAITGDLFLVVDVEEQEVAAMKSYLGLQNGWTGPDGALLLRISSATGQFVDKAVIDLDTIAGGNPFEAYYSPSAFLLSGGYVLISLHGTFKNAGVTQGDILLRYLATNLSDTASVKRVVLSLFPTAVDNVCHPATSSVSVASLAIKSSTGELLIGGAAGYRQEPTGSVTAGGKAFLAYVDANDFFEGHQAPLRTQYFGVKARDNSIGDLIWGHNGTLFVNFVFDRGLTHDPPAQQGQHAGILVTNDNPLLACSDAGNSDWWLECEAGSCLSWCFEYPLNQSNIGAPFSCGENPDGGDGLSPGAIVGIAIGGSAAVLIVVLLGVGFIWFVLRRSQYTELGSAHTVNTSRFE